MTPRRAALGTLLGIALLLAGLYLLVAALAGVVYGVAAVLLGSGAALTAYCLLTDLRTSDGTPDRR